MNKGLIVAIAVIMLVVGFAIGSVYFDKQQTQQVESVSLTDSSLFNREYSQSMGGDDAKVIITEFLDPGCETCSAMHPFIKQILAAKPGRIKLIVRYAPLHHGSDGMVKILEAAKEQGKYWETLEVMYDAQPYWASHSNPQPDEIWKFLPKAGLDIDKLKADMNKPEIAARIQQDIADAHALSVTKTPGYFVNGRPLIKFGYEELLQLIQSEYDKNYKD